MKKSQKIILVSIALLLCLIIVLAIKKHNANNDDLSVIVVSDGLSINYLDGDEIYASNSKNNTFNFSITNNSDSERYYQIDLG